MISPQHCDPRDQSCMEGEIARMLSTGKVLEQRDHKGINTGPLCRATLAPPPAGFTIRRQRGHRIGDVDGSPPCSLRNIPKQVQQTPRSSPQNTFQLWRFLRSKEELKKRENQPPKNIPNKSFMGSESNGGCACRL